jgi:hypothetical protein
MRKNSLKLAFAVVCSYMLIATVMSHSHNAKSGSSRNDDANGVNTLFRTYSDNNKTIGIDALHRFLATIENKTILEKVGKLKLSQPNNLLVFPLIKLKVLLQCIASHFKSQVEQAHHN